MSYRELLLGCGVRKEKMFKIPKHEEWANLTTVDFVREHRPDLVWDLTKTERMPLDDNSFDEIHAIEVLEHLGQQGDFQTFFWQFEEYWRLLKPGGLFCATVPKFNSEWAWGDPGHRRVITQGSLVFLSQAMYQEHVGKGPMSDYRQWYDADFDAIMQDNKTNADSFIFVLKAIKPSRKGKE